MFKKIILPILALIFVVGIVSAADWTPYGDINLRNRYNIKFGQNGTFQCLNLSGSLICNWSATNVTDTNASTECTSNQVLLGNGSCMAVSLFYDNINTTDTNVSTFCNSGQVLLANGSCMNSNLFFDNINTTDTNVSTFCTGGQVLLGNGSCQDVSNFYDDTRQTYTNLSWDLGQIPTTADVDIDGFTFKGLWNGSILYYLKVEIDNIISAITTAMRNNRTFTDDSIAANITLVNRTHLSNFTDDIDAINRNWFDQSLNTTDNVTFANITSIGYIGGQPLDGSIGSGIIWTDNIDKGGNFNLTYIDGLDVTYPNFTARLAKTDNSILYCNITGDTVTVPDDAHTVYYVDDTCTVKSTTMSNYVETDLSPGGLTDIFNVYAVNGEIEIWKGITVKNKETIKTRKQQFYTEHLKINTGMAISIGAFPEIYQTIGDYFFIRTLVDTTAQNSSEDGLHLTYHSGGSLVHENITGVNLSSCDDGSDLVTCPNNRYRRYIFYTIGFSDSDDNTHLHQLVPLTTDTNFFHLADCLNTEKTPLSYTLPIAEEWVAVVNYVYCGRRDNDDWVDGWIDIRVGREGFGAAPDTSIFLVKDGTRIAEKLNITGDLNVTGNGTFADVIAANYYNQGIFEWISPEHIKDVDKSDIESDLNTFVDIPGDIMTGPLVAPSVNVTDFNVSNEATMNIICFNPDCTAKIYHDGTGIIIES